MITIIGQPDDPFVREMSSHLQHRREAFLTISQSDLRVGMEICWQLPAGPAAGYLGLRGQRVPLDRLSGVLLRLRHPLVAVEAGNTNDLQYVQAEFSAAFFGFLNALSCPVVNRHKPGVGYRQPAAQAVAKALCSSGLSVPRTLATSSLDAAQRFFDAHDQHVLSGLPDWGQPAVLQGATGRDRLAANLPRPFYLQAIPRGHWFRVFLAGGTAFAAEAEPAPPADGADRGILHRAELPVATAARCRRLGQALGLDVLEILLLRAEDGRELVFGLDDLPSFDRCDGRLLGDVVEALAEQLLASQQRMVA